MPERGAPRAAVVGPVACLALIALLVGVRPVGAQFEMPDPIEMSGIPLPSGDLADGVVSVRVIRGELSNNVVEHPVDLVVDGEPRTAPTNEFGRAEFSGLQPGASVQAVTEVDGRRLESQTFPVPARGGVRVMLVAPRPGAAAAVPGGAPGGAAARPGSVTFGGESRVILELGEDNLEVYYLLDVVNAGSSPVTPDEPVVLELPSRAVGVTVLQGSSPQARVSGSRIEIAPPFQPGRTHVEVAYFMPYGGGEVRIEQGLPAALGQVAVLAQRHGEMTLESPQIQNRRDVAAEGRTYIVANGPGVPAGSALTLVLRGLPHQPRWPSTVALVAAMSILAVGLWVGLAPRDDPDEPRRRKLESRRERLFGTLMRIEEDRRAGRIEEGRYAARRNELVAQLERVYRALDERRAA